MKKIVKERKCRKNIILAFTIGIEIVIKIKKLFHTKKLFISIRILESIIMSYILHILFFCDDDTHREECNFPPTRTLYIESIINSKKKFDW